MFPPEDPTVFFEVDDETDYSTIDTFRGDFVRDILENCTDAMRSRIDHRVASG